jgi:regulation of enolase protein 1 (concanavalin A-like superfamily)
MQIVSFQEGAWLNEPKQWSSNRDELNVTTDANTDFWRETYYAFVHDNGHFLGTLVKGDFTAQMNFRAVYSTLYDQAGLMVRIDERNWLKTGIEYTDGKHALSTVVTVEKSDWSVGELPGNCEDVMLRLTISNGFVRIQASTDGKHWPLFRVFPFPKREEYLVGPMCCSPKRAGFKAQFSKFLLGPPTLKDLHDLT